MKRIFLSIVLLTASLTFSKAQSDESQIKEVITSAYVNGIHNGGPIEDIKAGFHQAFKMMMLTNGNVSELSRDGWIERIEAGRKRNPNPDPNRPKSTGEFARVSIAGTNATVELHLMREGKKIFTDNLALYKVGNKWQIVSKTFYRH